MPFAMCLKSKYTESHSIFSVGRIEQMPIYTVARGFRYKYE